MEDIEELLCMLDQVQFGGFIDGPTEQEYDDVVYKRGNDDKPKRADERKDDILAKIKVGARKRTETMEHSNQLIRM